MDDSNYTLDEATSPESSSESEGEDPGETTASPFLHHSNSSFLMANAFAPPYYNRPPTPLPASPSLTSLLRPPFSTTTSRPTTPDSSEGDTPNDTEGVVAKSARIATTVPRASPKVPTYEYYGFVVYLLSGAAFCTYTLSPPTVYTALPTVTSFWIEMLTHGTVMYLLWSYLPSPFLRQLGIHYYPNRWWSLAIPSYLVMTIVYIYVALASYNMGYLTLPMGSLECIVDEAAHVAVLDGKGRLVRRGGGDTKQEGKKKNEGRLSAVGKVDWKSAWSEGTDAVMDVPVGGVCEILYG